MIPIRLTNPPSALLSSFPENERTFYYDYSEYVFSELVKDGVQSFLDLVIEEEKLDSREVLDIRIMRFPFGTSDAEKEYADRKKIDTESGTYFGHYIPAFKRIDIYPPKFNPKLIKKRVSKQIWDTEELRVRLFRYEPVKTLLHEFLHIKYKNEKIVERLCEKYMVCFDGKTKDEVASLKK